MERSLNEHLIKCLFNLMINNDEDIKALRYEIEPWEFGTDKTINICKIIYAYYDEHKVAPKDDFFHALDKYFEERKLTEANRRLYDLYLDQVFDLEFSRQYVLTQVREFKRQARFDKALVESYKLIEEGQLDKALGCWKNLDEDKEETRGGYISSFMKEAMKTFMLGNPRIKTGIAKLDEKIGGIFGVTILGGEWKMGKTTVALNIAAGFAWQGIPIIYLNFENEVYWDIIGRLVCIIDNIYQDDLVRHYIRGSSRWSDVLFKDRIWIENHYHGLTVDKIERLIDKLKGDEDNILVVVDSLQTGASSLFGREDIRASVERLTGVLGNWRTNKKATILAISELSNVGIGKETAEKHLYYKETGKIGYGGDILLSLVYQTEGKKRSVDKPMKLVIGAGRQIPTEDRGLVGFYTIEKDRWIFGEEAPKSVVEQIKTKKHKED